MFASLIVGFGHAGRNLHLPCLRKVQAADPDRDVAGPIAAVDPVGTTASIPVFSDLDAVRGCPPDRTVVHICTHPASHADVVEQVVERGYTRLVVEKPLASAAADVNRIGRICERHGVEALVVAPWLYSEVTDRVRGYLLTGEFGPARSVRFEQSKPRTDLTLSRRGSESAFDIEMPHQVALAFALFGPAEVLAAEVTPLRSAGREVPDMGFARIELAHPGGIRSVLVSDLQAAGRVRRLEVEFKSARLVGDYPVAAGQEIGGLTICRPGGSVVASEVFRDDPLTACLAAFYAHFDGRGPKPISGLGFNASVVSVLDRAKQLCGVPQN